MSRNERQAGWPDYSDEDKFAALRTEEMEAMPDNPKGVLSKPRFRYIYRSSVTGSFVSKAYALQHPNTTVRERVVLRDEGDVL